MEFIENIHLNVPAKFMQQIEVEAENVWKWLLEVDCNNTPQIERKVSGNNNPLEVRKLDRRKKSKQYLAKYQKLKNRVLNNESYNEYQLGLIADSETYYS